MFLIKVNQEQLWMQPSFKVGLSPSKKNCYICFNESPMKMIKNAFYVILKTSQDI